jgi:hypothetical protein
VTGQFEGTMGFDPGAGTASLSSGGRGSQAALSAFVLKLDASNTLSWAGAFQASTFSSSDGDAIAVAEHPERKLLDFGENDDVAKALADLTASRE